MSGTADGRPVRWTPPRAPTLRTWAGSRGIALAPSAGMRTIKRAPRRAPSVVGVCGVCGVKFAASRERQADAARVLRVHESICPGGQRSGRVAMPFE